jgi:hypothetical protein
MRYAHTDLLQSYRVSTSHRFGGRYRNLERVLTSGRYSSSENMSNMNAVPVKVTGYQRYRSRSTHSVLVLENQSQSVDYDG